MTQFVRAANRPIMSRQFHRHLRVQLKCVLCVCLGIVTASTSMDTVIYVCLYSMGLVINYPAKHTYRHFESGIACAIQPETFIFLPELPTGQLCILMLDAAQRSLYSLSFVPWLHCHCASSPRHTHRYCARLQQSRCTNCQLLVIDNGVNWKGFHL